MAKKKKLDIAPEDQVIADNLGVKEEPEATKPATPGERRELRKRYRRVREATNIGGALTKEERQAKDEARLQAGLAKLEGVPGLEKVTIPRGKAYEKRKAEETKEKIAKEETFKTQVHAARKGRRAKAAGIELDPTRDFEVNKEKAKKEAAEKEKSLTTVFTPPKRGRFEKPVTLGGPDLSTIGAAVRVGDLSSSAIETEPKEFTPEQKAANSEKAQKAYADKLERQQRAREGQAITEAAMRFTKEKPSIPGKPQYDPMLPSASLRPMDRGLAADTDYHQTSFKERAEAALEKARPVVSAATGKAPEAISFAGDEPYDVKDAAGNVVATRTVNSHALSLAQAAHRKAKRTGKEVEGFKPTDPRPKTTQDILGGPHQRMAYAMRHIPGLEKKDVESAPGLSREKFERKTDAMMSAAVLKADSERKINVANEVQPHHKGWEDEKGIVHPFVWEKTEPGQPRRVSPLSLPNDFTRTAVEKPMVHIPEDTTESLMGAEQVPGYVEGAEHNNLVTSVGRSAPKPVSSKSGMLESIKAHEPETVSSHEGWTLHSDDVWRKIQHPLTNVPEGQKMHAVDYAIAQGSIMTSDKEAAAKKAAGKSAGKKVGKAIASGDMAMTSQKRPFHFQTNPVPPKGRGPEMLVRDTKAVNTALKQGKITKEEATEFNPQLREKPKVQSGIVEQPKNPNEYEYLTSEELGRRTPKERAEYKKKAATGALKYKSRSELKTLSPEEKKAYMTSSEYKTAKSVQKQTKAAAAAEAEKRQNTIVNPRKTTYTKLYGGAPSKTGEPSLRSVGSVESPAFSKAKGEVSAGRQWRTVELGDTIKTVYRPGATAGLNTNEAKIVNQVGAAYKMEKNTIGLTPKEARKKGAVGQKSIKVMADDRGPVRDTEVFARMQNLPEKTDVAAAVKAGHIGREEAKELRSLDQFSKFRPQGQSENPREANYVEPKFEGAKAQKRRNEANKTTDSIVSEESQKNKIFGKMKNTTLFEPVANMPKAKPRKGSVSIETLNERIAAQPMRTPENMLSGGPVKSVKEPKPGSKAAAKIKPVPKSMERVYGEKLPVPAEKPTYAAKAGRASEGRSKQFGNFAGPVSVNVGNDMVHPVHGQGRIVQLHEAGSNIPGTGKVVQRGNATKETVLKGAKKFATPHVTFAPHSNPASPVHVPVSDFQ
jgi:hypothetical protein